MPIARIALPVAADTTFDYWAPEGLGIARGSVVRVRLGPRKFTGVVMDVVVASDVAPRKIADRSMRSCRNAAGTRRRARHGRVCRRLLPGAGRHGGRAGRAAAGRRRRGTAPGGFRADAGGCGARCAARARCRVHRWRAHCSSNWPPRPAGFRPRRSRRCRRMCGASCAAWREREWVVPVAIRGGCRPPRCSIQCGPATRDGGNHGGARHVLAVRAVRRHRQRQDRRLPRRAGAADRGGRAGAAAGSGNQSHAPAGTARARGVARRCRRAAAQRPRRRRAAPALASRRRRARPGWCSARGSRVFAPMPSLSLIIVDEEHDASYKQQDNVRYHARDVAVWRAHRRDVPIVLGSATPSLESWLHAAKAGTGGSTCRCAPIRGRACREVRFAGNRPARALEGIGEPLRAALAAWLARGEQSLVFVNRRGFSPSLLCSACGWEADCPRCSARLTVHRTPAALRCHHCGHDERAAAGVSRLRQRGPAAAGLRHAAAGAGPGRAFPAARIARIDRDSTRSRGAFASMRDQMAANELDILDRHADAGQGPRFSAADGGRRARRGQCAVQRGLSRHRAPRGAADAGRRSRGARGPGRRSHHPDRFPDHPVYAAIRAHDYERLAENLLAEREIAQLPPFTHVALLAAEAHQRADVDAVPARCPRRGNGTGRRTVSAGRDLSAGSRVACAARRIRTRAGRRAKRATGGAAAVPSGVARRDRPRSPGAASAGRWTSIRPALPDRVPRHPGSAAANSYNLRLCRQSPPTAVPRTPCHERPEAGPRTRHHGRRARRRARMRRHAGRPRPAEAGGARGLCIEHRAGAGEAREAQSARTRAGAGRRTAGVAADRARGNCRRRIHQRLRHAGGAPGDRRAGAGRTERLRAVAGACRRARHGRVRVGESDRPAARRPRPAGGAGRRDRGAARVAGLCGHARVLLQRRRPADPQSRAFRCRRARGSCRARTSRFPRTAITASTSASSRNAIWPRSARPEPRERPRCDPPLRRRAVAAGAGPGPARAGRHLRQLLPRELAVHGRAGRRDGGAARRIGQDLRAAKARCGSGPPTTATTRTA